ncbi:hypothetical protein [Sphaerisporangium dianthi]|uniref:DUF222 domain-containing protein n=1 Tax=Sphaerisporangium dianthi TaxID=1436120 RepID=A0ABV9CN55_9ACTN
MSNPDQTLAAIDDVLAGWEAGPDAMVWTAGPPEAEDPAGPDAAGPRPAPGPPGTAAPAVRAPRPVAVMLTTGFAVWARSPAVRRMVAYAQSLEDEAVAETCGRRGGERGLRPCLCLCGTRHGERGDICEGEAVGTHPHESLTTGLIEVPMCRPCLSADRSAPP